jgi:PTS system beta-glucosides-specific IIC component
MATKNEVKAKQILEAVGGIENVTSIEKCLTRLRFTLKDNSKANKEVLEKIEGVRGISVMGEQFQVVIGSEADDIYRIYLKDGVITEKKDAQNKPKGKTGFFDSVMDTLSGSLTPVIPIIVVCGLLMALANLLAYFNVISADSDFYNLLDGVGDAGFYFLPIFVGYFAAKKMNTNGAIGMLLGAVLLYPSLSEAIASEGGMQILGLTIPSVTYSSTIIPILLIVWALSYVEKFINKILPKATSNILNPLVTMLVMIPLALLFIGPLGNYFGQLLSGVFSALLNSGLGWLAVGLVGLAFPVLVSAGAHIALTPIVLELMATNGFDSFLIPAGAVYNMACAGTALAVAIKSKNKNIKSTAYSATFSAIMGISEPALFGIGYRVKGSLVGIFAGGLVGGLVAGLMQFKVYTPLLVQGLYVLPTYADEGNNLLAAIVSFLAAIVTSFLVTYFRGFEDPQSNE